MIYSETPCNEIFRSVELPANVDPEKVTANLVHGVLTITLTKAVPAKAVKITAKAA
jgi:HSP20 family molecular chaperone IbpA